MKLQSASIRVTLIGFAIGAVLFVVVPVTMIVAGFSRAGNSLSRAKGSFEILRTADSIQRTVAAMQQELRSNTERGTGTSSDRYREAHKNARSGLQGLELLVAGNQEQHRHVQEAEALLSRLPDPSAKPATQSKSDAKKSQPQSGSSGLEVLAAVQEQLLSLTGDVLASSGKGLASATHAVTSLNSSVYTGVAAYALVLLGAAFVLARYIASPIGEAVSFAEAITRGEMSQRLSVKGCAEVRALEACLNAMAASLTDYNQRVLEGVDVLTGSVAQIAGTASQVLTGASQTASAVNETTTIVNEMERGAKVVNETARRVAEHSEQSDAIANSGTKATRDTLQKMNLIKEKMEIVNAAVVGLSDKTKLVESIISAVQDLADQSNLLAVNASIEAARAGEHGKGFAVVASEIKSLADQSREATQKVSRTLQEIRSSVGAVVIATEEGGKAVMSGVEQSEVAGEAIQKLAGSIGEFSQAAGIIFASSGKQFSRVERIAAAMKNVELAMNSSVEGTTHVENEAKRLEGLALTLTGLVRQHKTAEAGR